MSIPASFQTLDCMGKLLLNCIACAMYGICWPAYDSPAMYNCDAVSVASELVLGITYIVVFILGEQFEEFLQESDHLLRHLL